MLTANRSIDQLLNSPYQRHPFLTPVDLDPLPYLNLMIKGAYVGSITVWKSRDGEVALDVLQDVILKGFDPKTEIRLHLPKGEFVDGGEGDHLIRPSILFDVDEFWKWAEQKQKPREWVQKAMNISRTLQHYLIPCVHFECEDVGLVYQTYKLLNPGVSASQPSA